ncbi:MAG: hypothetical protein V1678_00790 [Candidatus Aenigmatarchaeota archaeon]
MATQHREIGSSFSVQPMTGNVANYVLNDKSSINGGLVGCITDYFQSIGGLEKKVTINPGKTLPVHIIRERLPTIGFIEVRNYDNRLELELPENRDEAKVKELMLGFENVLKGYPDNAENLVIDLEKRLKRNIDKSANERKRYPELYEEFDWRNPPKYVIPVPIRVAAKRIYYKIKDSFS